MSHIKQLPLFSLAFILLLLSSKEGYSQSVGINYNAAAPNSAAALDIDVSALSGVKKGLLIPRVSLADRTAMNPLTAPSQGLLVYQTDGVQGFYYNTSTTTTPVWIYLYNASNGVRWDQLQDPTAGLNMTHGANSTIMSFDGVTTASAFAISSNSLTTGSLLDLTSTSTASPAISQVGVLTLHKSGANTNAAVTSTGIYSSVTNTGTGSVNSGGYFYAAGGATNYGLYALTDAANGYGLYGINNAVANASNYGVAGAAHGNTTSGSGYGVSGRADGTGTYNYGGFFYAANATNNSAVQANTDANGGYGVYGWNSSAGAGFQTGVSGNKTGNTGTGTGYGVSGSASGSGNSNYGGYFTSGGANYNEGVHGEMTTFTGAGVYGLNSSTAFGGAGQFGVYGSKTGNTGSANGFGVYGTATGTGASNFGGNFYASGATTNYGVLATIDANNGYGVFAQNTSTVAGTQYGIRGSKTGSTGSGTGYAIYGTASGTGTSNIGGYFTASGATNNYAAIFENGNVGIGVTTPDTYKLEVSDRIRLRQGPAGSAGLWLYQTTPAADRAFFGMVSDNVMGWWGSPGGGFGLQMDVNSLDVGIGATPSSSVTGAKLFISSSGSAVAVPLSLYHANGDGIYIQAGMDATPGSYFTRFGLPNATIIGGIVQASTTGVSYNTTSDRRLKNIIGESKKGLTDLMKIKIYDYTFKADVNNKVQTGFMAQELYEIFPQSVNKPRETNEPAEKNPWMVDYGSITPLIIKAVQEQQQMIALQKEKIEQLEKELAQEKEVNKKIEALTERLNKLEKQNIPVK